jgi:hypothetical protein
MMETVYLLFVLCLGADCESGHVFVEDKFSGVAAVSDCDKRAEVMAVKHASDKREWRIGCRTLAQFENEGV